MIDQETSERIFQKFSEQGYINNEAAVFYCKDKACIFFVLISGVVAELNNEKIIVCTINDITELRKYQAEVRRLERLNLLGEMASGIYHEIRNPLTTIKGFLQILSEKEDNTKYLDYYKLMIEELDRVNSIITEFLTLTKKRQSELKPANLTSIVKAIQPLLESDAIGRECSLEINLKPVPDLLLDQKEIRQLILNLVRNAFETTGVNGLVKIMVYQERDQVVLAVADNGSGIAEEVRDKIGTPFFTTKDSGTCLGLSVCYSIVERHNAILDFDTSPQGTTFYVKFKEI